MAAPKQTGETTASQPRSISWADVKPAFVPHEDAMSPQEVRLVWEKMRRAAGLSQADEKTQAAFRLAVYAYCCVNGTSRVGNYSGRVSMFNGQDFDASVIPKATGPMAIRRFMRGCMLESYDALKMSRVIEEDERAVTKAANLGIDASCAFAMSDWMQDCPKFTPAEKAAYEASFTHSLSRSRRARDGRSLEAVEEGNRARALEVQGALNNSEHEVSF